VALEPLVAELLAVLIQERHRVVERGELFDRLWPNQLVSDSALSRLIYTLRKALDDAADSPRFIRTVPRRGFQFIADVTECAQRAPSEDRPVHSGPTGSGLPDQPLERRRAARRSWRPVLTIVFLLALLAMALLWSFRAQDPPQELGRIALLGSLASGADAEGKLALLAVSDMLWVQMKDRLKIDVRSPHGTTFAASSETVAAFARDNAADSVLALEVGRATNADVYTLTARLIQFSNRQALVTPLGRFQLPALLADSDLLAFRLARDSIVSRLVDDTGQLLDAKPERLASSVEAWRLYLLARERLHQLTCGADDARALLERAVELDPDFALGWVALGFAHYNSVWACDGGRTDAQRALAAAHRARSLDSIQEQAVFLEASLLTELGDAEQAVEAAENHLAAFPQSAIAMVARAYALSFGGEIDAAAAQIDAALAIDPLVLSRETGLIPTAYLHVRRFDAFLELFPAPQNAIERFYAAWAALESGQEDLALAMLSTMNTPLPRDRFERFGRVLRLLLEEDFDSAEALLSLLLEQRRDPDSIDGEMDYKLAQLLALAGRESDARAALRLSEERGFRCAECIARDPGLSALFGR
jgi:tetratricopeptide (TPR) repeat protein